MIELDLLSDNVVRALGSTLIHFVWQGALIAAVLAGVRLFVRRPERRYVISCAALVVMVLMAAVTFSMHVSVDTPLPAANNGVAASGVYTQVRASGLPGMTEYVSEPERVPHRPVGWERLVGLVQQFTPEIVMGWLFGVLALSVRMLGGCWVCYRLRRTGIQDLPDHLAQRVDKLIDRLGIRQKVRVVVSTKAAVPMVVGILRPIVLFPASSLLGLSPDQLQAVLVHELTHVRRYDNLVNLFQHVVETIFFYHPAVWWVSRCIRVEREHCCDDAAAAASDPHSYAVALAALEELRAPRLAAAATDGSLLHRIRRLLAIDTTEGIGKGRSAMLSYVAPVLVALVVATVAIRGVQAEEANVAVDVAPALPHGGSTLASCMTPMMQLMSGPEWSHDRIQGVMGHAFYFPMKEGAGSVMHDDIDWGIAMRYLKGFGVSKKFNSTKNGRKNKPIDLPALKAEARDAVQASLEKGVPALVWQPMSPEMKANHGHAYCWGLIVGYNESDETYSVRHPFVEDTYTVRYDAIGHADGAEWFNIQIFDRPSIDDEKAMHLNALKNAVAFSKGTRFEKPKRRGVFGLASYEMWGKAFDAEEVPPENSRWHTKVLRERRTAAAGYARELAKIFPDAAEPLNAAANHYDREVEILEPLWVLCDANAEKNTLTAADRATAQKIIGQAFDAERAAVAELETALKALGVNAKTGTRTGANTEGKPIMDVRVDVQPAKPHYGTSMVACLNPIMEVAGKPEWTMARLQGVLGHAFHFEMRERAGTVYHDAPDWSFGHKRVKDIGTFKTVAVLVKDKETDRVAALGEARDFVVEGLKRGMPAMAWSPISPAIKAGPPPHAVCWGLIVGYNEEAETYTVRHPWVKEQYTVRYDEIGPEGGADWLNFKVLEKPHAADDKGMHAEALRNAVQFAHGVQYSDKTFTRPNGKKVKPYGFAAYETWREAFVSGEELGSPPRRQGHNADMLKFKRQAAADYLREMVEVFPTAAEALAAGAGHYDREQEVAHELSYLFGKIGKRKTMTKEERERAAELISQALEAERAAVGKIEVALTML